MNSFHVSKTSSVRFKLGISFFLLAMIPFVMVCIISVVYFQNDKRDSLLDRVNSDLDWLKINVESHINNTSAVASRIGFNNSSTRKLTESLLRITDLNSIMRKITLKGEFEDFKQHFVTDVRRVMLVSNALNENTRKVGKIVFSAKKEIVDGETKIEEDTIELASSLSKGLLLDPESDSTLSKLYAHSMDLSTIELHDFTSFQDQYSFFITVPISKSKGYVYNIPYLPSIKDQIQDEQKIESDFVGVVIIQVVPSSFKESLGNYRDIGETFLAGSKSDGSMVIHTESKSLNSETGEPLQIGEKLTKDIQEAISSNEQGSIGERFILGKKLEFTNTTLYLAAIIEKSKVFEPVRKLSYLFVVIWLVGLIAIITGVFLLSSSFARPLNKLVKVLTETREKGDYSVRTEVTDKNEIAKAIFEVNQLLDSFQQAISDISLVMEAVSTGDLTREVSVDLHGDLNTLKTSINRAVSLLGQTIFEVVTTTNQVQSGISEISDSAASLAQGTTEQAAGLEQISSSLGEVSSQAKSNSDQAMEATRITNQTQNLVQQGNQQMKEMQNSMNMINQTSGNVSKVIKAIDEIAFQTNLLALNAAVEAARAGKYGKGFAVVAEEVRNLASRSAEAAKDTTNLIQDSIKEVETGMKNSDKTAKLLESIVAEMDKVNGLVQEISSVSVQQETSIQEINDGIGQINSVVQKNSAISEELASSVDTLTAQADQQKKRIESFSLNQYDTASEATVELIDGPSIDARKLDLEDQTDIKKLVFGD